MCLLFLWLTSSFHLLHRFNPSLISVSHLTESHSRQTPVMSSITRLASASCRSTAIELLTETLMMPMQATFVMFLFEDVLASAYKERNSVAELRTAGWWGRACMGINNPQGGAKNTFVWGVDRG
eukprot:277060-Amphidinium_carterae.1